MLKVKAEGSQMNNRREFSAEEKCCIIEKARQPGTVTAEVDYRHNNSANTLLVDGRVEAMKRKGMPDIA